MSAGKAQNIANGRRAQSLDVFDTIDTDIESSQEAQCFRGAKIHRLDNTLFRKSPSLSSSARKEHDRGNRCFVMPPIFKPSSNAVVPAPNGPIKCPELNSDTQPRAKVSQVIQSVYAQEFTPNTANQTHMQGVGKEANEMLPWEVPPQEIPMKVQPTDRVVPEEGEEPKGGRCEVQIIDEGDHLCPNAIRREKNPIQKKIGPGAEEEGHNQKRAAQAQAPVGKQIGLIEARARKSRLADEVIAKVASPEDPKAEDKSHQESKANGANTDRRKATAEKERLKKHLGEKPCHGHEAEAEEAHRTKLAVKEKKEEIAKRNARRREIYAQKKASVQKVVDNRGATQLKQAEAEVGPEEAKSRTKVQTVPTANAKDAPLPSKVAIHAQQKARSPSGEFKPAKISKVSESTDARNRKSSTPSSIRSGLHRVRSSMTPVIPGTVNRSTSSNDSTVTSRLSAQTPLRSALRQNSSVPRRSISWVDQPSDPTNLNSSPIVAVTEKLNGATSRRSLSKVAEDTKSPTSSISRSSDTTSMNTQILAKDLSTEFTPKEKVQTKLNIKRDKKLKGREVDPPKLLEPAPQEEVIIPSDSEKSVSTFYSDDEDRPRNAKAGPSSKKKPAAAKAEAETSTKLSPTSDTPTNKIWESSSQDAQTPSRKAVLKIVVEAPTRSKSLSRSPARYMSGANVVSSESASESGSDSDSGSDSGSESGTESGSSSGSDDKLDTLPAVSFKKDEARPSRSNGGGGEIEMGDVASVSRANSGSASQSSQSSSRGLLRSEKSTDDDSRRLTQDADQQLQRECRQSLDASSQVEPSKAQGRPDEKAKSSDLANNSRDPDHPVRQRGKSSKNLNQGSFKGNLSAIQKPVPKTGNPTVNGLRPAYQRYSSIKDLMKEPKAAVKPQTSSMKSAASQGTITSTANNSMSSSSESDSESSDDNNGDITANCTSQNSGESKHKAAKGVKGVIKRMLPWVVSD